MKIIDLLKQIVLKRQSAVHLLALMLSSNNSELTMTELANEVKMSTAAATSIVDALEIDGLIKRERRRGDRRKIYLVVTEEGEKLLTSILAINSENNT